MLYHAPGADALGENIPSHRLMICKLYHSEMPSSSVISSAMPFVRLLIPSVIS